MGKVIKVNYNFEGVITIFCMVYATYWHSGSGGIHHLGWQSASGRICHPDGMLRAVESTTRLVECASQIPLLAICQPGGGFRQ